MRGSSGRVRGEKLVDDMIWMIWIEAESFRFWGSFEEFPKKGRRGLKMCQSILFEG